jgi:hypothetical protein
MPQACSAHRWRFWRTLFDPVALAVLLFALPARVVPVPAQVGGISRNAHVVSHARRNVAVAAGAYVLLERFVRLNPTHLNRPIEAVPQTHPRNAHVVIAAMITKAEATINMSLGRFTRLRIGLNPIPSVLSRGWKLCWSLDGMGS